MTNQAGLPDYRAMLAVALEEARQGLAEGGIPIGAALFDRNGQLLGRGHNRRVQENDPSVHGETDAFRKAGRQRALPGEDHGDDAGAVLVLQRADRAVPDRHGGRRRVASTFRGGIDWLRESGVKVIDLESQECIEMLGDYIAAHPEVWNEDIGEE